MAKPRLLLIMVKGEKTLNIPLMSQFVPLTGNFSRATQDGELPSRSFMIC